ncbi:MAG: hypothetical protein EHM34_04265 [Nitrosopumilales archaeon]|nr:MAG: hypothetical protein EHM34_04265 [Nitrosopumilales archaeon]
MKKFVLKYGGLVFAAIMTTVFIVACYTTKSNPVLSAVLIEVTVWYVLIMLFLIIMMLEILMISKVNKFSTWLRTKVDMWFDKKIKNNGEKGKTVQN